MSDRIDSKQDSKSAETKAGPIGLTRRRFLRSSSVATASLGAALSTSSPPRPAATAGHVARQGQRTLTSAPSPSSHDTPQIRRRATLGRTQLKIPDISFGTFSLESDENLVRHALDRGITHFDTAEGYTEGRAETVLGKALAGHRHEVTLTSKFVALPEHTVEKQMRTLEGSLRRLGTDYIDIYLNHAVNDVDRLRSEHWQAFADRAKREGKIRHVGMSGHSGRLGQCIEYALDEDLVDVLLVAYNFSQQPSFKESLKQHLSDWVPQLDIVSGNPLLPSLLTRAHESGVGVMVMKTLKGARLNDMRPFEEPGRTFAQSAFRWVLSEPSVDGLVVSMTSESMVDEYVEASGSGEPDLADLAMLGRYSARNAGTSCLVGCDDCNRACPAGVQIGDVLRTRMYDRDYGQPKIAAREYAQLDRNADACLSCSGLPCAGACTSGLEIADLTRDTARRFSSIQAN
jgi:predicted aldo/keto reductase-like oxidoreductase